MKHNEWQEVVFLADTIIDEINRMCVTDDLAELDSMAFHAKKNLGKLRKLRYEADFRGEER